MKQQTAAPSPEVTSATNLPLLHKFNQTDYNEARFIRKPNTSDAGNEFNIDKRKLYLGIYRELCEQWEPSKKNQSTDKDKVVFGIRTNKKNHKDFVRTVIVNLIEAIVENKYLIISLRKAYYTSTANKLYTNYTIATNVYKGLERLDYISLVKGFYNIKRGEGRRSIIAPTEKFESLFNNIFFNKDLDINLVKDYTPENDRLVELVSGKNKYKERKFLDFKKTRRTRVITNQLKKYNKVLNNNSATITLNRALYKEYLIDNKELVNQLERYKVVKIERISRESKGKESRERKRRERESREEERGEIEGGRVSGYRIGTKTTKTLTSDQPTRLKKCHFSELFNDPKVISIELEVDNLSYKRVFQEDFLHHGRFYQSGGVQTIKKDIRQTLKINNNPTAECDVTSIHPNILYSLTNITAPSNIYLYDKELEPRNRELAKILLLVLINKGPKSDIFKAAGKALKASSKIEKGTVTRKEVYAITEALKVHHKGISKYFETGFGVKLMYYDSLMAEKVIKHFTDQKIPIFCIHDSYVCESKYYETLKVVMEIAYREVMNTEAAPEMTLEYNNEEQQIMINYKEKSKDELFELLEKETDYTDEYESILSELEFRGPDPGEEVEQYMSDGVYFDWITCRLMGI